MMGRKAASIALALVLVTACANIHEGADGGSSDAASGVPRGWLRATASLPARSESVYELAEAHMFYWEHCSDEPLGTLERGDGAVRCELTGPWYSRHAGELAIDTFCDDSLIRTAVYALAWNDRDELESMHLVKVDGEAEWSVQPEAEWAHCAGSEEECGGCR